MNKAPLFIANDQTVANSYNFYVDTAGIDLESRFNPNPVCLNNHNNDTKDVLGQWIDIEVKDGKLLMRPKFDTEDPDGKEVVRKVLSGILKGCSLGIMFDPADLVNENGKLILKKCVLFEVSIVAVPSNGNAIALFSMDGKQLSETEINTLCLSLQTVNPFENNKTMKILLAHLQLPEGSTEEAILTAVKATETKLTESRNEFAELKTKYDTLKTAQEAKLQAEYEEIKLAALKDGRIDAESVPTIEEMAVEKRIELLNKLPKRKSVKDQIDTDDEKASDKYQKLSWDDMDKKGMLAQLKADFPDLFTEKYEEKFGSKPSK
ncbi:HK97 family phage prohead protease [Elizabethkingia anophelis]|uniref:HK97 family phage prohead protease n=1 Tax=Elizabethkingia anophelis TaxID=1117645 RepID=UPI00389217BC